MTSATDTAKAEVQAALLNLLESGVPLYKIRVEPLCRQFQLSCKKDKAAMLIEEILKDARVNELLIRYLTEQTDEEIVSGVASRKQALSKKPALKKLSREKSLESERDENIPESPCAPPSRANQRPAHLESNPRDLRLVQEVEGQHVNGEPSVTDQMAHPSGPDERLPNVKQAYPAETPSLWNDNGTSLEEAMCDLTDAFHTFSTSEPSLLDVAAVTRYLRSATTMANARAAS